MNTTTLHRPSRWIVGILSFAIGTLLALGVAAALAVRGCNAGPMGRDETPPTYSRNDFAQMIMNKTEEEVRQQLGEPDRTSNDSDSVYWHYRWRTVDPENGEKDSLTQLIFRRGRVAAISY
ncbi:MAG: hypothetical protein U0746_15745 [Gemmataceae bacterium]